MGKILLLVIIGVSVSIVLVFLISFVVFAGNVSSSDTGQNIVTSRINQTDAVDIHDLEPQVNVTKD